MPSSKHAALTKEQSWQQQGGVPQTDMVSEFNGSGLQQEHSGAYLAASGAAGFEPQQELVAGVAAPKKKAPGLKKKLTNKVSAARMDASLA